MIEWILGVGALAILSEVFGSKSPPSSKQIPKNAFTLQQGAPAPVQTLALPAIAEKTIRQEACEPSLSDNATAIQNYARQIEIPYLVHFTRAKNLPEILEDGLLSIELAKYVGIEPAINDEHRWDQRQNATSLSIAFPNHKMFWKYRQINKLENWVVLLLSPSILWTKKCAFCKHNAADKRIRYCSDLKLENLDSFTGMFDDIKGLPSREMQDIKAFHPTDVQAEVLVFDVIDPEDIIGVVFETKEIRDIYEQHIENKQSYIHPNSKGLFSSRGSYYSRLETI